MRRNRPRRLTRASRRACIRRRARHPTRSPWPSCSFNAAKTLPRLLLSRTARLPGRCRKVRRSQQRCDCSRACSKASAQRSPVSSRASSFTWRSSIITSSASRPGRRWRRSRGKTGRIRVKDRRSVVRASLAPAFSRHPSRVPSFPQPCRSLRRCNQHQRRFRAWVQRPSRRRSQHLQPSRRRPRWPSLPSSSPLSRSRFPRLWPYRRRPPFLRRQGRLPR